MPTIAADGIYYIDLGDDPDFTPGSFISTYPEECSWDEEIRVVGNISWQISFGSIDQDGDLIIDRHDRFGPWRSYFRLRHGNIAIMAGVITNWTTKLGTDFMGITGKTWEAYPGRWQYPFDPRGDVRNAGDPVNGYRHPNSYQNDELIGSGVSTPTGLAYQASNRDVIRILSDLFETTMNVPNRLIFDISTLVGLSGIKTNITLPLGDTSYMDSYLDNYSGLENGFDWWISWDRKIYWASPYRFGNPSTPSIVFTFDSTFLPDDLDFGNNGPNATHVFGQGSGLATSNKMGRAYGYTPAQVQFSRLDMSYDFGDIRNVSEITRRTQKQLSNDLQPQHEIPLAIDPSRITDYWTTFRKGRAIYIDVDLIAHRIDSAQQLKSYKASLDNEGNCMVDWTLSQIYDLAYDAGSAEG